jgi:general secretion pathway protein D
MRRVMAMKGKWSRRSCGTPRWVGSLLILVVTLGPAPVVGAARLTFEDADIKTVIAEVGRLTGTTFLFDPARVKGRVTLLAPDEVTPEQALELLRSALALHGYEIVTRPEGMLIVPAPEVGKPEYVVEVVPLTYADAGEVAWTLGWIAPPGVRVVPYLRTNSVVIAGHTAGVEQMKEILRRR